MGASWGNGDGGGASDISEVYVRIPTQSSDYTVISSKSTMIPVDSSGGVVTITTNDSVIDGIRVMVYDAAGAAGTNHIVVENASSTELVRINTDEGKVEMEFDGVDWGVVDRYKNILDRDEATGEISPSEPGDNLVLGPDANNRTKMTSDGLEVVVGGQTVSQVSSTSITSPTGQFGQAGAKSNQSVADGDFTNLGVNVDQQANDIGNTVGLTSFNDGDKQTSNTTSSGGTNFITSASSEYSGSYAAWVGFNGTSTVSDKWLSGQGQGANSWLKIDMLTSLEIRAYRMTGDSASNQIPKDYRIEGSNDDSSWVTLHEISGGHNLSGGGNTGIINFDTPGSFRYFRIYVIDNQGSTANTGISEMEYFSGQYATTDNTFDSQLASGSAGTFVPSSFAAYDENAALINGTGKLQVATGVDGADPDAGAGLLPSDYDAADYTSAGSNVPRFMTASSLGISGSATIEKIHWTAGGTGTSNVYAYIGRPNASNWDIEVIESNVQVSVTDNQMATLTLSTPQVVNDDEIVGFCISSGQGFQFLSSGPANQSYSDLGGIITSDQTNYTLTGPRSYDWGVAVTVTNFEDMTDFQARTENLTYTTQFDMRFKLIGDQRLSYVTISTPDQVLEVNSDGSLSYKKDGLVYGSMSRDTSGSLKVDGINGLDLAAGSTSHLKIDASGNVSVDTDTLVVDSVNNRVGLGTTSPEGKIHIETGPVVGAPNTAADELVIKNNSSAGLSIITPNTSSGYLMFGDPENRSAAWLQYSHVDMAMRFVLESAETMRIDASGQVGIGTTSPQRNLHVHASSTAYLMLSNNTSGQTASDGFQLGQEGPDTFLINREAGHVRIATSNTEALRIDASGQVGLGTTSPSARLDVTETQTSGTNVDVLEINTQSGGRVAFRCSDLSFTTPSWLLYSGTGEMLSLGAGANQHLNIDASGNVLVGKTSSTLSTRGAELRSTGEITATNDGDSCLKLNRLTSDGVLVNFEQDTTVHGTISISGSTTSYNTTSDHRLKENVIPMTGALARVDALKPSRFNFIAKPDRVVDGFIAHEVQEVVPEAVTGEKDAMKTESFIATPALGDLFTPAVPAVLDEEGNEVEAAIDEIIHDSGVEKPDELADGVQWRETQAAVMGEREVEDYQGIDQSKLSPVIVGAVQELHELVKSLQARILELEK